MGERVGNAWWPCLDDKHYFGSNWQCVYEFLPEMAAPPHSPRKKHNKPDKWREDPHHFTEIAAAGLLRTVAAMYLPIADQGAFDTKGHLRLIYLDCKRNISKETSVEPDEVTNSDVIMEWFIRATPPESWEEGTTGDRYRIKGDLTRELY
ncbi:hypothetical protein BDV23DRAFT_171882 [Aspergillus alliaceus]|uniref:Uncharacterized protein n=1 Tax=Petromyces alliaceus TaxID=209559 RepID=A0A5N7CBJ5_PETAA|nr:hypothetical protein BDV23DRAFT_171882 [Aspergillus alliaceus]